MLVSTLLTAALALYCAKTGLSVARDQDVRDAYHRLKTSVTSVANSTMDKLFETSADVRNRRLAKALSRQDDLMMSRVFGKATDSERETLMDIFSKYCSD
jgi:hypothetical protein